MHSCEYNVPEENEIYVVILLPKNNRYLASYSKVRPAINVSLSKIKELGLLPNIKFNITDAADTKCDSDPSIWEAVKAYIELPVHLFLGPSCDYAVAPIARLLKYMKIPMITAGALAMDFNRKDRKDGSSEYFMLVRTGWIFKGMANILDHIFKRFNWKKIVVLFQADGRRDIMKEHYCSLSAKSIIDVIFPRKNCTIRQQKLPENFTMENAEEVTKTYIGRDYGGAGADLISVSIAQAGYELLNVSCRQL
ncbi:atrial natriuretic peptide receptor 3-like [Uloborus diversus]|uniref:atrial natriuretic peptide receptor 3-like n=1 Tax=Uloborus diversus TaxID=327109 RepID=UPI00240A0D99|nr:atrial natriuretic peptide receptor 3-like [Uloborus diversus]